MTNPKKPKAGIFRIIYVIRDVVSAIWVTLISRPAWVYGTFYLALIPFFAAIYSYILAPGQFYHSTSKHEIYLKEDADSLIRELGDAFVAYQVQKEGSSVIAIPAAAKFFKIREVDKDNTKIGLDLSILSEIYTSEHSPYYFMEHWNHNEMDDPNVFNYIETKDIVFHNLKVEQESIICTISETILLHGDKQKLHVHLT